jgi:hypothetical protein
MELPLDDLKPAKGANLLLYYFWHGADESRKAQPSIERILPSLVPQIAWNQLRVASYVSGRVARAWRQRCADGSEASGFAWIIFDSDERANPTPRTVAVTSRFQSLAEHQDSATMLTLNITDGFRCCRWLSSRLQP